MILRAALMTLSLTFLGCGDQGVGSGVSRAEIVDGEVTTEFDTVAAIGLRRVRCDEAPVVMCSGTLIAPDAVLSAAHCFVPARPGLQYEVFFDDAAEAGTRSIGVLAVETHPGFDADTRADDVAVLWLAHPVTDRAPEALPAPSSPAPEIGLGVELVGFGTTTPGSVPDGIKRVGTGRVTTVSAGTAWVDPDPSVSCAGDSGGPLFTRGAPRTLIGVASSGDPGCRKNSVYALIAPAVEPFLDPLLQSGPPTDIPEPEPCGAEPTTPAAGGCAVQGEASLGSLIWGIALWLALVIHRRGRP